MTTQDTGDDLVHLIHQLVRLCKRYDERASSYLADPFRLSLDGLPEADLARVSAAFGRPAAIPVDFGYGDGPPMIHASCFIPIGSLTVYLCSKRRRATRAEIDTAVADVHRSAADITPSPTGEQ